MRSTSVKSHFTHHEKNTKEDADFTAKVVGQATKGNRTHQQTCHVN